MSLENFNCLENEMEMAESIASLRKFSREGQVVWHRTMNMNEKFESKNFAPFEIHCDTLYGILKSRQEIAVLSTSSVIGIRVPHCHCKSLKRCWKTYLSMTCLSVYPNSLFPIPLKVIHDNLRRTIFVFENPKVISLLELFEKNPLGLCLGLLRHPRVILAWCRQIGMVIKTLRGIDAKFLTTPTLNNAFIKEDGHLIFDSQLFDSGDNSSTLDQQHNLKLIYRSFKNLLTNIIGLSRSICIYANASQRENVQLLKQDSVLKIELCEEGYNLEKIFITSKDISHEIPVVLKHLEGKFKSLEYSYNEDEHHKKCLEIKGSTRECIAIKFQFVSSEMAPISKPPRDNLLDSKQCEPSDSPQIVKLVHIEVFANIHIPSIELQEVLATIESSCQLQQNDLLLGASAITNRVISFTYFILCFMHATS